VPKRYASHAVRLLSAEATTTKHQYSGKAAVPLLQQCHYEQQSNRIPRRWYV